MSTIRISKLDAARRHLRAAIVLLFNGADPVVVHTLVGVASVLAADLAKHHHPDAQWESWAQDANRISAQEYFAIARSTQNFLKHADRDVDAVHEFDPIETDALAYGASRNLANFGKLGIEESALELWYIACNDPSDRGYEDELFAHAVEFFGDLRGQTRPVQLAKGRDVLLAMRLPTRR
ncbi:hypothetical protein BLA6993_06929 [Burkholderia lata]|uniref:hypothetical protein n=1 Tax=Burkholderia lata (strain ATCC 17760 / DSM 23089 / LMG 22485 / NCIMB 9086 / R18194 / 383) TaxID=482957 RepID=UPI001452D2B3|nr:hypothetical protein [Burkholderia lata]VWC39239.1 hypothetical protein BLA6993_06929 [Burkholderia lata]